MNNGQTEYRKIQGLVGNKSFSLVLPKSFAVNIGIKKGDFVKVSLVKTSIIVEKADKNERTNVTLGSEVVEKH